MTVCEPFTFYTYCKDVIFSRRGELLRWHHAGLGLNEKLAMFVSFLDAVGDFSVWALVTVWCNHPIHRLSLRGSLSLGPLTLGQTDLIDLLQEQRPVVILVEDLDDDPDAGGFGRNTMVGDGYLRRDNKDFKTGRFIDSKGWNPANIKSLLISYTLKASFVSYTVIVLGVDTVNYESKIPNNTPNIKIRKQF